MEPGSTGGGGTGNPLLDIVIVLTLILAGGFFAASEIALITVKRHRLRQLSMEGSRASRVALRLTENPSRFLATAQIGMTFLGFLASAVGAVAFSDVLADGVRLIPLGFILNAADTIAFVLMTMFIALASIIIGELVPKTLALSFTERLALIVAHPINFLDRVLSPIVWFVSRTSLVFVKALGGKERPDTGYLSTEELKILVETGSERGDIEEEEKEMIHGVIELGDKSVHEVMVPRIGIRAVDVDAPLEEVLDLMMNAGHSRVPVYTESLDTIVGILYAKDLLPYLKTNGRRTNGSGKIDIRNVVREPVYVPETKRVDELLREMRQGKTHMAIVVDEYGGTAGLITMEDLVEEIVGEIQDEYDTEESLIEPVDLDGQQAFRVDGRVSVDDLRDLFDLPDDEEPDEDDYDTVGGLIINRVGRIPLPGAEVPFRDLMLRVEAADPRRVAKVLAVRQGNGASRAAGAEASAAEA
ncbi:MAG: hemolysin family protein [Candidatus Limnocylindria bacterium]